MEQDEVIGQTQHRILLGYWDFVMSWITPAAGLWADVKGDTTISILGKRINPSRKMSKTCAQNCQRLAVLARRLWPSNHPFWQKAIEWASRLKFYSKNIRFWTGKVADERFYSNEHQCNKNNFIHDARMAKKMLLLLGRWMPAALTPCYWRLYFVEGT